MENDEVTQTAGDGGKAQKLRRRITPIFNNPQRSRILGVGDAHIIDVNRFLKVDSKRPQKATAAFIQKCKKDTDSHLEELSNRPGEEKVLRWEKVDSFTEYPTVCSTILEAILQRPDWVVHVPLSDDVPEVLKSLDKEQRSRVHLGLVCRLSAEGEWETSQSQAVEAQQLGFKIYLILEYERFGIEDVERTAAFLHAFEGLQGVQININPKLNNGENERSREDKAREIFRAFRSAAEEAGISSIRVKYDALAGDRSYWVKQFGPTLENPFSAFAPYFGASKEDDWAPGLKKNLVDLLHQADHTLKESVSRAYLLYKIRLLMPEKAGIEKEPSFAKACEAVLNIGKSEVYRKFKTGRFVHLLETKGVPKDKWPTRGFHVRNLLESKMSEEQQVTCWKRLQSQHNTARMTEKIVTRDVNAFMVEHNIAPKPTSEEDLQTQFIKGLRAIANKAEKDFPGNAETKTFVDACNAFLKHLDKKGDAAAKLATVSKKKPRAAKKISQKRPEDSLSGKASDSSSSSALTSSDDGSVSLSL